MLTLPNFLSSVLIWARSIVLMLHQVLQKTGCICKRVSLVGLQPHCWKLMKGHKKGTCFEQVYSDKFLTQVKSATAESLKKSLQCKNNVLLATLCCSKFAAASVLCI